MKNSKLAIPVLALLLVGAAASQRGPTNQMEATLLTTDPVPLQTGEDADINFKIENKGTAEADNVEVRIVDSYPFRLKPDRQRNYSIGSIKPGEAYYISTDILVEEGASDGSHDLKVEIAQSGFSRVADIPLEVQGTEVDLNLANLKTAPDELMPDTEDNKLTLSVVNNGDEEAENVVVDLDYPEFFEERSSFSRRQALGNLDAGETKKAEFFFDLAGDAPEGPVEIPSTIRYTSDDSTAEIEKTETFNAYISAKPQYEVVNVSSNLERGSRGKVEIEVRNTGNEESVSTRIRVLDSSDQPFSYASSSQYIGTLEPGQTGTAIFEVTPESDAETKDYLVDFEIRGKKDTTVFTEDTTLKLSVNGSESQGSSLLLPVIAGAVLVIAAIAYFFRERIRELAGQ
jgi:hypothetical protein